VFGFIVELSMRSKNSSPSLSLSELFIEL
jgi:hypothetical protein